MLNGLITTRAARMLVPALVITAVALYTGSVDAQCFSSLDNITLIELYTIDPFDPLQVLPREYILCPFTDYVTGYVVNDEIAYGQQPLFLRSNATIKCGEDGKRENNCTILDGTNGLFINSLPEYDGYILDNVVIQGLTFRNIREIAFLMEGYGGKVHVIDCAFIDTASSEGTVVLLGVYEGGRRLGRNEGFAKRYSGESHRRQSWTRPIKNDEIHRNLQNGPSTPILDVTFKNCLFSGNIGRGDSGENGFGVNLISIVYESQKTTFAGCTFIGNDFSDDSLQTPGRAMIWNENGGELILVNNCFVDNSAIGALVFHFSKDIDPVTSGNYVAENTAADVGWSCDFLAWFNIFDSDGVVSGEPTCVTAESDTCIAELETIGPSEGASIPIGSPSPLSIRPTIEPTTSRNPVSSVSLSPQASISTVPVPVNIGPSSTAPSPTSAISSSPIGTNIFSVPNECTIGMFIADRDRNEFIVQDTEYSILVNRLSSNAFLGLNYTDLPLALQRNYEALAHNASGIMISGSKPGQIPTEEQVTLLQNICERSDSAITLALNPMPTNAPKDTPIDTPVSQSPVSFAPSSLSPVPIQLKPESTTLPASMAPTSGPILNSANPTESNTTPSVNSLTAQPVLSTPVTTAPTDVQAPSSSAFRRCSHFLGLTLIAMAL